jgi:hypothetical protein
MFQMTYYLSYLSRDQLQSIQTEQNATLKTEVKANIKAGWIYVVLPCGYHVYKYETLGTQILLHLSTDNKQEETIESFIKSKPGLYVIVP